jgi:asparagine synthase (glutamine-hydrolysing)
MCGIVGLFARTGGAPLEPGRLEAAMAALNHRGPDARGSWYTPDRRVGLGHLRLSIMDPEGGAQPISNEDGSTVIVGNGEIYDFESIRLRLMGDGHRFRTRSDTEVALHLFDADGTAFVDRLRGEFALLLWDDRNDRLIAVRDRFGVKPLYYAERGGTLLLASELKALFAAGVPARWDCGAVAQSIHVDLPDDTPFAGIRQVPPGHLLVATRRSLRVVPYWDVDFPTATPPRSLDECVDDLRDALDEAVRTRLRADVPVGVYLSGGLDSSAVLASVAACGGRPRAFTVGFEDNDESPFAREMARFVGIETSVVRVTEQGIADNLRAAIWHVERPIINGNGVAKYLLSRLVHASGYKVVLTGEGSDELLAGYPHFGADYEGPGAVATLAAKNALAGRIFLPRGTDTSLVDGALRGVRSRLGAAPTWLQARVPLTQKLAQFFTPDALGSDRQGDRYRVFLDQFRFREQLEGRHPVHQAMYLNLKSTFPCILLDYLGDRMDMANAVEARLPFLDERVVEVVRRTPVDRLFGAGLGKHVLRRALADRVPEAIRERAKHPFHAPQTLKADGPLMTLLQDEIRGTALEGIPFLEPKKVVAFADKAWALHEMEDARERAQYTCVLTWLATAAILAQTFGVDA